MQLVLNDDTLQFFIAFVLPGLVSMSAYRLLMPARSLKWGDALLQGFFYSALNFVVLLPLIAWSITSVTNRPVLAWLSAVLFLLVFPVLWPILLRTLFKWDWLSRRIQIPYPTAWDYFFDLRESVFVLIHLNNDELIGGYWGRNSYAGSFPNDGDIYLEAVYEVNDEGRFGDPIPDTRGLLLRKSEYSYVELLDVGPGLT